MPVDRDAPFTIPLADGPIATWLDRSISGFVAIAASVSYGTLLRLSPDARGHGTHEQLGWSACGWPLHYGIPCPTCGCTTAACLLVHGRIVAAFVTQPFGAAFAAVGLLLGVHALLCLLRGRSFVDILVRARFWRWLVGAIALLLAAWAYTYATWERS
jgi:hypothetical protein